jgi:hypothetical protein
MVIDKTAVDEITNRQNDAAPKISCLARCELFVMLDVEFS